MKLRNKRTGEIHEITQVVFLSDDMNKKFAIYSQSEGHNYAYRTIAELNKEWEDAPEEPKGYWYMSNRGDIRFIDDEDTDWDNDRKLIGNYFGTREEAKKAVEKLKAWKRLKDKGYYFRGWSIDKLHFEIELRVKEYDFVTDELKQDLDLLFGGEE